MNYSQESINLHRKYKGKITLKSKIALSTREELSLAYTPGVGAVCQEIFNSPQESFNLTNRGNQVAIVSDGTAILGLGNLGPEAAMPVMEGKAIIFKEFADIDAMPLCINAKTVDEIVNFCKAIEPSFVAINLEDIASPTCFEVTKKLEQELNIPFFHDDQDGTAVVTLAALINACKLADKKIENLKIIINGAGAAGLAIAKLLNAYGTQDLIICDSKGVLSEGRGDLNGFKKLALEFSNKNNISGKLEDAIKGADVFIGISQAGALSLELAKTMAKNSIIFAMANPVPEIMPDEAYESGAFIVGTGRSDFENQINNALVFPGLFQGVLKNNIKYITQDMLIKAAIALANSLEPTKNKILPLLTDRGVAVKAIASSFDA